MSTRPQPHQESAWFRLVRLLVLLYVRALDRRIARLIIEMHALPMDPAYDAAFARLDDRCYGLECLRDHYKAWLADPGVGLPRFLRTHEVIARRWLRARRPVLTRVWASVGCVVPPGWRHARCRCALS